jgi:hypothetical protein
MARKTVTVCDSCEAEIENGTGAKLRLTYEDARKPSRHADLCSICAGNLPGNSTARRGRKPTS